MESKKCYVKLIRCYEQVLQKKLGCPQKEQKTIMAYMPAHNIFLLLVFVSLCLWRFVKKNKDLKIFYSKSFQINLSGKEDK